jgi:hypothetical protein
MCDTSHNPEILQGEGRMTTDRLKAFARSVILGVILLPGIQYAAADDSDQALINIIKSVERGWETADSTPFRQHFLDFEGARYIESGGQNEGLDDLVTHHVEPEGDALDGLDLTFSNIETHIEGDFAWAVADVEFRATVKQDDRKIHSRGHETFLFRCVGDDWKVVHTHSSSRPVTE